MTNVLVCVKRVPQSSGEVVLTDDAQSVDARYVGWTVSAHEEAAVEVAVQVAAATGGSATVLSVGSEDAVEQLRASLAVGCTAAVLVEADPVALGPADVAKAIGDVVRDHEAAGTTYDLVLLGTDAADTGDFQVGVRLGYELDRPVASGAATVEVSGDVAVARVDGPDGTEIYELALPAVVTVAEGGVEPRYPSIPGRMKAKKVQVEQRPLGFEPVGPHRVRLTVPPPAASNVQILGEGAAAAPAVVDLLEKLGVLR